MDGVAEYGRPRTWQARLDALCLSNRALVVALGVLFVEVAVALVLVLDSNHEPHKVLSTAFAITAGISFAVSGLIAIRAQPQNRTGLYLAGVGYLWFLGALPEANNNAVFTAGVFVNSLAFVPFAALVLGFPTGVLQPADRLIVKITAWFVLLGPAIVLLVEDRPLNGCKGDHCPTSEIVVFKSHTVAAVVELAFTAVTIGIIAAVAWILARRWRAATPTARRTLGPVYAAAAAALVALSLGNLVSTFSTTAAIVIGPIFLVIFGTVPLAFLYGLLRSRLARGSVASLVLAIGEGTPLRDAIAAALNDPSLELAYWLDDRGTFVDRNGRPLVLGPTGVTLVERDGRRVGALVHDPSLTSESDLVQSVAAAAALALDNERLQAELRAQLTFLQTILQAAPSLVVNVDTEGRIVALNRAALTAAGRDAEDAVVGRHFWHVMIDQTEREAMIERFHAAAPGFAAAEYENTFTNARGERLTIAWRSAPVVDDAGRTISIIAGGIDITDRKRQEQEIRDSRARIVAAADDARRNLERNLHDGAQQRLVALSLGLRMAQAKLADDPKETARMLADASEELAQALTELRELARGIHPALLTERGLKAALEALADRTPLPVELSLPVERLPAPLEAAAYYVVSESIANVIKHAHATSVRVRVSVNGGSASIEVEDNGIGGADAPRGSGLRGLADRLAALDGTLLVESPPQGGTRVVADAPLHRD